MKKDVIFFDLDGTLTDSKEGILNSFAHAAKELGLKKFSRDELEKHIGPPIRDTFLDYFDVCGEQNEAAVHIYREYFSRQGIFENEVYAGIATMLESLAANGKTVVLATSKAEPFALRILEHFDLMKYFTFVAGGIPDGSRMHKIDVLRHAVAGVKVSDLSSAVMVGDRKYDVEAAAQLGIESIGVLYGYGNFQELTAAGASYIVKDVSELEALLLST